MKYSLTSSLLSPQNSSRPPRSIPELLITAGTVRWQIGISPRTIWRGLHRTLQERCPERVQETLPCLHHQHANDRRLLIARLRVIMVVSELPRVLLVYSFHSHRSARRMSMVAPLKVARCFQAASTIKQVTINSSSSSRSDEYGCSDNASSNRDNTQKFNRLREDLGCSREPLLQNGTLWLGLAMLGASLPTGGMAKEHVMHFLKDLRHNPVFMSATIAWFCAQFLKVSVFRHHSFWK